MRVHVSALSLVAAMLLLSPVPGAAQECTDPFPGRTWSSQIPDRSAVVRQLKDQFADEWAAMNTASDLRFIKRVVWTLCAQDAGGICDPSQSRWGLNGKRGSDTLSEDVIAYLNPTVKNAGRPGMEAVDFVIAHGSPSASVGWNNITCPTDHGGAGGKWFKPEPVGGTGPIDPPPPACAACEAERARLKAEADTLRGLLAESEQQRSERERERDEARAQREAERARADALQNKIDNASCISQGWLPLFGARIPARSSCQVRFPEK